jgi:hypothetical protein
MLDDEELDSPSKLLFFFFFPLPSQVISILLYLFE